MQCHILSFEGPDPYAEAGGLASRVKGLSDALATADIETHLWFVGDPTLPGHELRGSLHLHRWCQWISRYHVAGVYDGEEGKRADYASSLPPFLMERFILPAVERTEHVLVMAEEWHTVDAVLHLDWLLRVKGLRRGATLIWNANNTFGFHRIDWERLRRSAIITTVSRYMKGLMQGLGIEAVVIPNGLPKEAYSLPRRKAVEELRTRLDGRSVFAKVARWDPAKRWEQSVRIVRAVKDHGWRPLLIARGGNEPYGQQVWKVAADLGLRCAERALTADENVIANACTDLCDVDILNLVSPIDAKMRALLFASADAVLANSVHEPFGLVGLEAMAVKGLVCIGDTGEDYAIPGYNSLAADLEDPCEFVEVYTAVKSNAERERALRRAGRCTAERYAWPKILEGMLLPKIRTLTGAHFNFCDLALQ